MPERNKRQTPDDYVPGSASPPKERQPGTFRNRRLVDDVATTASVIKNDAEIDPDDDNG
jgi:hypothetical protein